MMEAILFRGDETRRFDRPVPLTDANGVRIGTMTGVRFDGRYTVGIFEAVPEDFHPPARSVGLVEE